MSLRNKFGILAVAAAFAISGCTDTIEDLAGGDEGSLNQAEKAALINAINNSGHNWGFDFGDNDDFIVLCEWFF